MKSRESNSVDKLDSVQLLRAIAAIAVVTHHIPVLANGRWGVDLFFVISGFIMCHVTKESRSHFLLKRVIRVVPLYWAGTLGVFCIALAWPNLLYRSTASVPQLLQSLAFIPFQKGPVVQPMLFLGWTLNYEMFFYLLFSVSMALSHTYRAMICSAALLAIVMIGSLQSFDSVVLKFYSSGILIEFVLGMLCYGLYSRSLRWRAGNMSMGWRLWLVVAGVCFIACMPFVEDRVSDVSRPIVWGLPAALSFLLIVHGLSGLRLPKALTLVGDSSYSLYLFHPYLINAFDKAFHAFDAPDLRAYTMAVIGTALCCVVSVLIYRLIELRVTTGLRRVLIDRGTLRPVDA